MSNTCLPAGVDGPPILFEPPRLRLPSSSLADAFLLSNIKFFVTTFSFFIYPHLFGLFLTVTRPACAVFTQDYHCYYCHHEIKISIHHVM